ncbi:HD domain-containing phosphohydrolase [Psychrosphaera haliotis]|uniref:Response regulator n=1 Tax=Psychrosphaera haliotis TaxID=555083 RepID=A0A6N8FC41_9GAMM|nr:HD domain-containing phosphohydrolase [Psychrosphaera haliotis]MUH71931.1 response regulator [Psychrosphaera haliotis]
MSEKYKILVLDDEVEILNSLKRVFRKDYAVDTFSEGEDALAALAETDYAIVISDMKMPGMDGATFLAKAKEVAPESVRILLSGYADMDSTIKAINEGDIFNYVCKPWNNDSLKALMANAISRYSLKSQNNELSGKLVAANTQLTEANRLLEEKVAARTKELNHKAAMLKRSTIKQRKFFRQILDMVGLIIEDRAGHENGHSKRVAAHSKVLAEELGLSRAEAINIYLTGLMHEVGKVAISDILLQTVEYERTTEENIAFKSHAVEGAKILSKLPNLREVAENIRHQYENYDGSGYPDNLKKEEIPFGSRLLKVVSDYDYLLLGHKDGNKLSPDRAAFQIKEQRGKLYDYKIADQYLDLLTRIPDIEELDADYCVATNRLEPGMIVSDDVKNKTGGIMLTKDTTLTEAAIAKLVNYEKDNDCFVTVFIY